MPLVKIFLTAALVVGVIGTAFAEPGQKGASQGPQGRARPPVIINDPSAFRPPPPPPDRNYVGPAPSVQPPMQRVPPVAPLAQPPIR